ncbi:putative aminoadipate reductase [Pholiota molesta]|nr:putative aminoadipate reductase [Pholiota molesta]
MALPARTRVLPPVDGSLSLPETLAFHESHNADVPMYVFCEDGQAEVTEISYRQFVRACYEIPRTTNLQQGSADWPDSASGKPVVALIALTDTLIYQTTVAGLMHAGFIPFPISPRNTAEAIANLIRKTDCHQVLATWSSLKSILDRTEREIHKIEPGYNLTIGEVPTVSQLYPELCVSGGSSSVSVESKRETKPGLDEIALYLHSSGSTGLPKAIPKTHRELIEFVTFPSSMRLRNRDPPVRFAAMHLPPFHALGLHCHVFLPLLSCITAAIYPPCVLHSNVMPCIPTSDNILDHTQRTRCSILVALPSLLQDWVQDTKHIHILSSLLEVKFSGGALSPRTGQFLVENGVKLSTSYGGTEFGAPCASSIREGDEQDWEYVEFSERSKVRWVPQGNGLYECQFIICDTHHISVENLSDVRGYATSDLFVPHPTKNYLWKIVGRIDDVIIHSSGEKTVPPPMENILYSSPHIVGAVMFGHAHNQPGVLIEPSPSHRVNIDNMEEVEKFRNLIWPIVEEANSIAPAFSRIFKELILVADYKKPFLRAGKGTVMRKATLDLYAQEVEVLYSSVMVSVDAGESVVRLDHWEKEYIEQWIMNQAHELYPNNAISPSVNLFEQGFDSLSTTILRRRIIGALRSIKPNVSASVLQAIDQNIIYTYPTITALSKRLFDICADPSALENGRDHLDAIQNLIIRYSFETLLRSPIENADNDRVVVLLTGSTGHLGSHILASLLRDPQVTVVYTLNRLHGGGLSTQDRHRHRFVEEGLDATLLDSTKLIQMEGDYEKEKLGISEALYIELLSRVTIIIHTSWRLDFNLPLSSFEPNIRQTHNLIKFARSSACGPRLKFLFTSSVSVGQSWKPDDGPYPEDIVLDAKCAMGMGYGESKYVAERILQTSGLNTISLRISQITGSPANGSWATTDWVPIMIKSSIAMGAFPSAAGRVSWIPVATVSDIIHRLLSYSDLYPSALNILHHETRWTLFNQSLTP